MTTKQLLDSSTSQTTLLPFQVSISIRHLKNLNFALWHNKIDFIQQISITNDSDETLENVRIHVLLTEDFAEPWERTIARIGPRSSFRIEPVPLRLNVRKIANMTEREVGVLTVSCEHMGRLQTASETIDVLAYNEWIGTTLPELIASFVQPNHPVVSEILVRAREHLQRNTGDPSFDGYHSKNEKRIHEMVASIYRAFQQTGMTYVLPPAGFETTGQKIRTPEQMFREKMGCCLDIAVFFAACLEQIGIHPLIFLVEDHAFCGYWLTPETLPECLFEEAVFFRKRMDLFELMVIDPTVMLVQPAQSLSRAMEVARNHLVDDNRFRFAVDIHQARQARILPLPARVLGDVYENTPTLGAGFQNLSVPNGATEMPRTSDGLLEPLPVAEEKTVGPKRIEKWKQALLDLTLRNRLLAFKETKKTLALQCNQIAVLAEYLLDQKISIRLNEELLSITGGEAPQDFVRVVQAIFRLKQEGNYQDAGALLSWLNGSSNVSASAKKHAQIKGDISSRDALDYLRGVLAIIKAVGYKGLVIVIDEVETILRMRSDIRGKSLNGLRQILDAVNDFPGLLWVFTGTHEFFDTKKGVAGLEPLHQRIAFKKSGAFASMRQPQLELTPFDKERLINVAIRLRSIFPSETQEQKDRIESKVSNDFIEQLANQITQGFHGDVGIIPRQFLRNIVNVLDLVDENEDYDPMEQYQFEPNDLTDDEKSVLNQAKFENVLEEGDDDLIPSEDVW